MEVQKLSNKELMESLFKSIKNLGYTIINIKYSSSYFIAEDEEDSVCSFNIKEIPGFLFGIWNTCRFDNIEKQIKKNGIGHTWADNLNISPLSELVFFTQFERDVDKFKPSRSSFVTGLYRRRYEKQDSGEKEATFVEEWNIEDLDYILNYMKCNRIKAYFYVGMQIENICEEKSYLYCLREYVRDWINYHKCKIVEKYKYKRVVRASLRLAKKLRLYDVLLVDRGGSWFPRIRFCFRAKEDSINKNFDYEDLLIDIFENKYRVDVSMDFFNDIDNVEEHRKLGKRFNKMVQHYFSESEKNTIIYCNCTYRAIKIDGLE